MEEFTIKRFNRIAILIFSIFLIENYSCDASRTSSIKKPTLAGWWKNLRRSAQETVGIIPPKEPEVIEEIVYIDNPDDDDEGYDGDDEDDDEDESDEDDDDQDDDDEETDDEDDE